MDDWETKYEKLLEEHEELEERYEALLEKSNSSHRRDRGEQLAESVSAFAEWQESGYLTSDQRAFETVSNQLWSEVAAHVRFFTRHEPTHPCPGPKGGQRGGGHDAV